MPELFTEVPQIVTAVLLSVVSGAGNFFQGIREGRNKHGLSDFAAETIKATTAGLSGLYLGTWKGWPEAAVFLVVLLAANNSNEVLSFGREQVLERVKLLFRGKS